MQLSLIITAVTPLEPLREIVITPSPEDRGRIAEAIAQGTLDALLRNPTYVGGDVVRLDARDLKERLRQDSAQSAVAGLSCPDCRQAMDSLASLAQDRRAVILCRYETPAGRPVRLERAA